MFYASEMPLNRKDFVEPLKLIKLEGEGGEEMLLNHKVRQYGRWEKGCKEKRS